MTDEMIVTAAPAEQAARVAASRRLLPRSTSSIAAAQLTGQGLAVVTSVLLARRLGVAGFGVYAFVVALVFVANVGTTFGTDMVVIREVAADRRLDRCAAALGVQLALSAAAIIAMFAVSAVVPDRAAQYVAPVRIFSLSLLPAAWFSVGTALLRGLLLLRTYATLVVAAAAVPLGAVATFVHRGDSLSRAMTVMLLAQVALGVAAAACCAAPLRAAHAMRRPSRDDVVAMAHASRAIGGLGMVGVLYQRLAMLGVSVFAGPAATGLYSSAARVVEASKTGHVALGAATFPLMAEAENRPGDAELTGVLRRSWMVCIGLAAAASLVLVVAGPTVVEHLYGHAYRRAEHAVVLLAVGIVPSTLATFLSLAMLAKHREREVLWVLALAVVVLAVALAVLVPALGLIGACWAMLAADTVQAVGLALRLRRPASQGGAS